MNREKSIGGYFELELPTGQEYHVDAIRLNTGRNAFEYILRAKEYNKVYLPYYTCEVMLEPIEKLNLEYEFYSIDKTFRPLFDFTSLTKKEVFVYTNYFGICDKQVLEVSGKCKNLIVDNAQAFFSKPLTGVDTFYSPRKFFGVPDGAYLYTDTELSYSFESDLSFKRFNHLIKRIDVSAEDGYADFVLNDRSLENNPIKKMSALTQRLLNAIAYEKAVTRRKENFDFLHKMLSDNNQLKFERDFANVPLIYPFLPPIAIRNSLINNKIYIAKYWSNSIIKLKKNSFEYNMSNMLLPLPIDQRYTKNEMEAMVQLIKYLINE